MGKIDSFFFPKIDYYRTLARCCHSLYPVVFVTTSSSSASIPSRRAVEIHPMFLQKRQQRGGSVTEATRATDYATVSSCYNSSRLSPTSSGFSGLTTPDGASSLIGL